MEDDEGEDIELTEGMPVENGTGERLGTLSALLLEESEEEAEFLVLKAGAAEHLVPFEAVLGVGDGNLVLDVPLAAVSRFPRVKRDADPTDEEMEKAYEVFDSARTEGDAEAD